MNRMSRRFWLAPLGAALLIPVMAALAGCPSPDKPYAPLMATPTPSPTPTPSATPTPEVKSLSGAVYDQETGKLLTAPLVFFNGKFGPLALGGTFTATYSAAIASPSITVASSGYTNLTVHGYSGGPLLMTRPASTESVAVSSRSIAVTAPPGSATTAFISVAVKRAGFAYAKLEAFADVALSEAGTASVDVALPDGEATVLAYGFDGDIAGASQGPVGETLAVNLKATPAFGTFRTSVSQFETDSVLAVGYYLTWPSESPIVENRLPLAVLTGDLLTSPWDLPPVTSFGIPGASYTITAEAMAVDASAMLAARERRNVTPGSRLLSWLPEATWKNYRPGSEEHGVSFQILPDAVVPGANAFVLDLFDDKHVWRVVSHQTSTASIEVPLFESLGPKLKPGTSYAVRLDSALNPGRAGFQEEAYTYGTVYGATYNKQTATLGAYRTLSRLPEDGPLGIGIPPEAPRASVMGANPARSPQRAALERVIRKVAGRSK